jgi:hypothetical protein
MSIILQHSPSSLRYIFQPIIHDQDCDHDEEELELSMIALHQQQREEEEGATGFRIYEDNVEQNYQFDLDWDLTKVSEYNEVDDLSFAVSDDMSICSDIARDRLFESSGYDAFDDSNSLCSLDDHDQFLETCDWKSSDIFECTMITPTSSPVCVATRKEMDNTANSEIINA